ncbi:MAG: hypothetical protein JSV91_09045 [Phycisphaerales bacterium]|nr:MAG: hypothetical protein JSV91_09045 [Phycisphaerales bacterium]
MSRILVYLLIVSALAAIILGILEFSSPFIIPGGYLLVATACIVAGFTVPALGCAVAFERGRERIWMMSGLLASAIAAFAWIAMVWVGSFKPILAMPPTCWAGLMLLTSLTLRQRLKNAWAIWLRRFTILLGSLLALHLCVSICAYPVVDERLSWQTSERFAELAARSGGVLAILTCVSYLVFLGTTGFSELTRGETEPIGEFEMRAVCPRCGARIEIRSGGDQCGACGLKIKVSPT